MKATGLGGALLADASDSSQSGKRNVPAGSVFDSPATVKVYEHALREADRLGMEFTPNISSGWNLGGPDIKLSKRQSC